VFSFMVVEFLHWRVRKENDFDRSYGKTRKRLKIKP